MTSEGSISTALSAFSAPGLPRLLFVTHMWGGGVEQHVSTLAALVRERARVMTLRPCDEGSVEISLSGGERSRINSTDWTSLVRALQALRFDRLHLHHTHGFPQQILDLDRALGVPLDCTLHDYVSVCPQYQLVDADGQYCGEPDASACNTCILRRPHAWQLSIESWREAFGTTLSRASRVFAPSMSVSRDIRRYFPNVKPIYLPHPERLPARVSVVKVALLGALSNAKGLAVARAVGDYIGVIKSPLRLRLIGHAAEPLPPTITATGSYESSDLPTLIAMERPDVIWLPSQVPETYSFTLSAALASGHPVVASSIGALAERLRDVPNATLLAYDSTAVDWHGALLRAARHSRSAFATGLSNASVIRSDNTADYATAYLGVLPQSADVAASSPIQALRVVRAASAANDGTAERPLLHMFRVGVYGGHRPSTQLVERELESLSPGEPHIVGRLQYEALCAEHERVQQQMTAAQALFDEAEALHSLERREQQLAIEAVESRATAAREYIAHLEAVVQHQQAHYAEVEARSKELLTSTSWQITRPLRVAVRGVRRARQITGTALRLIPRTPVLMRGGLARFRRGGLRSVRDRLAIEFRATISSPTIQLPGATPTVIVPLKLNTTEYEPSVSVLIPVYEQHVTTFACLQSIAENPPRRSFEVIVMDDCSPEPASVALAAVSGVRVIRNEANLGFIGNVNAAARHATGRWLIILNNDTVLRSGALDAMLDTFDSNGNVGLVGAKLLNADGTLQEAGGIVWRDGSAWNWGRGQDRDDPRFNFVRDADFCSGAALAISRALFMELGGLDTYYSPAYYEDTDLAFRIRARGLRVLYQPAAEIFHLEGVSHGRDESSGVKAYQTVNAKKFFARWEQTLATHRNNAIEPELEAHRTSRSNVLIVEACMITPDQDSGSVRMLNIMRILRTEGHHVTFVADNLDGDPKYAAMLTALGIEVLYGQYASSVRKVLRSRGASLDAIFFCRYYIAAQYISSVRSLAPKARIIFDTVDLHFLREEREAQLLGNAAMARSAALTRVKELSVIEKSDVTIVVSAAEKALLSTIMPSSRVDIVSNIVEPVDGQTSFDTRSGILFVGGFRHPPNVDAMKWYVADVLPIVQKLLPGVVTTVVGSNMPEEVRALRREGLVIKGFVEDTSVLLAAARVSIAPLRYGAGIKGKINEAMNHGIPVVATGCAVEGMQLVDGRDVLIADDALAFATAIARVHRDRELWNRLSVAGRANVSAHFSPEAARPAICAVLFP